MAIAEHENSRSAKRIIQAHQQKIGDSSFADAMIYEYHVGFKEMFFAFPPAAQVSGTGCAAIQKSAPENKESWSLQS
jgi:hypothetical protein